MVFFVLQVCFFWMFDQSHSLNIYIYICGAPLKPYIAWKNLTSAVLTFLWSPLDDFHSIHKYVGAAIVSSPSYSYALMTDKPSHSWHVLKSVHSSCHDKHCTWVCTGRCWQGPIINIAKQTARQSPWALTASSYKRKWKRRWIEFSDSSDSIEGIGSYPNLQAYFGSKGEFDDILS